MYEAVSPPSLRRAKNRSHQTTKRKHGRKSGARTKGYFYRSRRGWCASDKTPLTYQDGTNIKDRNAPVAELKAAFTRYLTAQNDERQKANNKALQQLDTTVGTICNVYLPHCEATNAPTTFKKRADYLFDLCTRFPGRFRTKLGTQAEREDSRIHNGYGTLVVRDLINYHVDIWLDAHPDWNEGGGRRSAIQAFKRAINYCVDAGLIPHNPIKGFKAGKPGTRRSNITPEQEAAIRQVANKAFEEAVSDMRTEVRHSNSP